MKIVLVRYQTPPRAHSQEDRGKRTYQGSRANLWALLLLRLLISNTKPWEGFVSNQHIFVYFVYYKRGQAMINGVYTERAKGLF